MAKRFLLLFFALALVSATEAKPLRKVKVSCVGNSITYGMKLENRERD